MKFQIRREVLEVKTALHTDEEKKLCMTEDGKQLKL